jgi:hypothetical protein
MRLLCPNCQQAITIPETEAGKTAACPLCSQSFTAPQLYAPPPFESLPAQSSTAALPVAAPPAPPPLPVAAPLPGPTPAPEPTAQPAPGSTLPEGYHKLWSLPLSRDLCHWLVPICLTLVFVLTFFPWIGFYPAGYPAYTQNPWQAMFGDMSVNPVGEKVFGQEQYLNEGLRASWWLVPYFLLLVFGLFLAWAEPLLNRLRVKPPPAVENVLRFRPAALAACVGLSLFLVLIQSAAGFGLENALRGRLQEEFAAEKKQASTPEEYQKLFMKVAVAQARFAMTATSVLRLVIMLHFVALAAVLGETLLIHRGPKPPPRVGVLW